MDEAGAVGSRFVRDGSDQGRFVSLHLGDGFGNAILSHDGDVLFALVFADSFNGAEGARVRGGGDEDVLVTGMSIEKFGYEFFALIAETSAIHSDEDLYRKIRAAAAYAFEGSGDAALYKLPGLGQVEAKDPVDFASPLANCMSGERFASLDAYAIVVHAEVGGMGMGDVDGDKRDASPGDLVADDGSNFLFDLELDDEVDFIADELFDVANGGRAVITVVEDEKVDANCGCCRL